MNLRELTPQEARVIVHKGTEPAFSGRFLKHDAKGTFTCRRCGAPLFASNHKFDSGSGWPSFDESLPGAVRKVQDPDGQRVEIVCARCGAHLGHVFRGEGFTAAQTRHCVNSLSLDFEDQAPKPATAQGDKTEARAYFAGGCFWGVEYQLESMTGVLNVRSGYMGGTLKRPTYAQVCGGRTGHAEAVEVRFDPRLVDFETLARRFFEIHDPTQLDRQGPDIGDQYRSAIFYVDKAQRETSERLIAMLKATGLKVQTELQPAGSFWPAEDGHQDYYRRTGKTPYCHSRVRRFLDD